MTQSPPSSPAACAGEEHTWLVVASTTFAGHESITLACEHCSANAYRVKEIDRG